MGQEFHPFDCNIRSALFHIIRMQHMHSQNCLHLRPWSLLLLLSPSSSSLPISSLKMHITFNYTLTFIKLRCLADSYCDWRALTHHRKTPHWRPDGIQKENYDITTKLAQVVTILRFPVRISAEILSWFPWFTSVPSGKFRDSTLHYFTMAFVHTLYN
jgi:hypothetical protein